MEIVFPVSFMPKALDTADIYTNVNSSGLLSQTTAAPLTKKVVSLRSQSKVWLSIAKVLLNLIKHCHLNSSVL